MYRIEIYNYKDEFVKMYRAGGVVFETPSVYVATTLRDKLNTNPRGRRYHVKLL